VLIHSIRGCSATSAPCSVVPDRITWEPRAGMAWRSAARDQRPGRPHSVARRRWRRQCAD
jgi:hypothetical protein